MQKSRFFFIICLLTAGSSSGARTIQINYGYGSGSRRPKTFGYRTLTYIIRNLFVRVLLQSRSKNLLDLYCFLTFSDFISLKNDVNVPSEMNKHKNLEKKFIVGILKVTDQRAGSVSGSASQRYGSENLDPYQNVTYLEH